MNKEKSQSKWITFWNSGGWWKAALAAFVYVVLYQGVSLLLGLLFQDQLVGKGLFDSIETVFLSIALPVMIGSVILLLFAKSIGWLPKPIFSKQPVKGSWWMWIAVVLVGATIILRLLGIDYGAYATGVVAMMFIAGIFIGLSEELLTRGLAVTMLRKKGYSEWAVMTLSSLIFSLMHSSNFLLGQSPVTVLSTMGFTFGFGIMMYLVMRVTGNIIYPIILHALTDPTTFLATGGIDVAGSNPSPFLTIAGLSTVVFLVFAVVALIFVRGKTESSPRGTL